MHVADEINRAFQALEGVVVGFHMTELREVDVHFMLGYPVYNSEEKERNKYAWKAHVEYIL